MDGTITTKTRARCFVCPRLLSSGDDGGQVEFRGKPIRICSPCRGRYAYVVEQAASTGKRFRFVEKSEIPMPPVFGDREQISGVLKYRIYRQIYMVLLLLKERQEKRKKEVNWMVEEMTRKILKLPDKVAAIVAKTYAVCGDDFKLADDQALVRIRDLLEGIDPEIISRNKNKRLPKA